MENELQKRRIVELDAAKGIGILCMIPLHVYYIGDELFGWNVEWNPFLWFVNMYWGAFFLLFSGICVTLGSKPVKRGAVVFLCGMVLTGLTFWMYLTGREDGKVLILWGNLHCIGACMMLWPLLKKIPLWPRMAAGAAVTVTGYYLQSQVHVRNPWLFPLGLRTWHFQSFFYFPLMPYLGWFLLGSCIGELVYKDRKPLIPSLKPGVLAFVGRHSLEIFMIHKPLIYIIIKAGGRQ